MAKADPNDVNSRLDMSSHGTPQLNPDQQRKYLGTFRERVSLTIKKKDVDDWNADVALVTDMSKHPDYILIINGGISDEAIGHYMQLATNHHVKFDTESDPEYGVGDNDNVIVFAAKTAINVPHVDWREKYPPKNNQDSKNEKSSTKPSFWQRLKRDL